MGQVGPA